MTKSIRVRSRFTDLVSRLAVAGLVLCSLAAVGWFARDAIHLGILAADVRWPLLATSVLAQFASLVLLVLCWQRTLSVLRPERDAARPGRHLLLRAYSRSWLARYIPGKVWMFGGRLVMGQRLGIPASTMARSMGLEVFFSYALLSLWGVAFLAGAWVHPFLGLAIAVCGVTGISLIPVFLNAGRSLQGGGLLTAPVQRVSAVLIGDRSLPPSFILWAVGVYSLHALLKLAFVVLLAASFLDLSLPQAALVAGIWAVSLLAGYLVVLAPAGLGIRDGVALGLLAPVLGAPAAGLLVAGSRIVLLIVDVAFVALVELATLRSGRRSEVYLEPPVVPQTVAANGAGPLCGQYEGIKRT